MKTLLATVVLVTLAGCSTPYQSSGMAGGVSHSRVAANRFVVRAEGNGFTSLQQMRDFAVLRAAELTLDAGYSHFTVTRAGSGMRTENLPTPVMTTTTGTVHTTGGLSTVNTQSITQPIGPTRVNKPAAQIAIECQKQPGPQSLDAAIVVHDLRTKYRLPR